MEVPTKKVNDTMGTLAGGLPSPPMSILCPGGDRDFLGGA